MLAAALVVSAGALPVRAEGGAADAAPLIDSIVNAGAKAWEILKDNEVQAGVDGTLACAIPSAAKIEEVEGGSGPEYREYALKRSNIMVQSAMGLAGRFVAPDLELRFKVSRRHGLRWRGKGKYLADVSVTGAVPSAGLPYKVSLQARADTLANMGTREDPVAAMRVLVNVEIQWSIFSKEVLPFEFLLYGDGRFVPYTMPAAVAMVRSNERSSSGARRPREGRPGVRESFRSAALDSLRESRHDW